jgi:uncharacterized phage protein (TIGR02216 family)
MIPWDAWMAHGIGRMRIPPSEFWRMSVREWRSVLGHGREAALTRDELDALLKEHPDAPE